MPILTVIGMFVGRLEPSPGPASLADRQRIERTYVDEIHWMREFLRQWPDQVRPHAGAPAFETDRAFARASAQQARSMRFVVLRYQNPWSSFTPVQPAVYHNSEAVE